MTARLQKLIVSLVMIAACVEGPVQTQPMSAHRDLGAVQDMGPGRSQDAVIAGSDAADTALQDLGLDHIFLLLV